MLPIGINTTHKKCHICIKTQQEKVSRTGIKRQNVAQNVQNLPIGVFCKKLSYIKGLINKALSYFYKTANNVHFSWVVKPPLEDVASNEFCGFLRYM